MRRVLAICSVLILILLAGLKVAAQATSVSGWIIGPDGKPWADIGVLLLNTDTGQRFDVTTDKNGRYAQLGLPPGIYKITVSDGRDGGFTYSEAHTLRAGRDNDLSFYFNKGADTPIRRTRETIAGEEQTFSEVKAHMDAGLGAMYDSDGLRTRLATAPADRRVPIQDELNSDYEIAIREFSLAEQADPPGDSRNLAVIWANLGEAYQYAGKYDDAITFYEKAAHVRPEAWSYQNLGEMQARSALALTDPKEAQRRLASAGETCDRIVTLDTAAAARCWKNIGRLLSNKGDMKEGVTAFQKTTQLNPRDSEAWFLLGRALLAATPTTQEGNQRIPVFPPGVAEAFQNCINVDPNSPYASQAKEVLNELASRSAGGPTDSTKR